MLTPALKTHLIKLQQKKYRKEFQEFAVEGIKGVHEALCHGTVLTIIVEGNRRQEKDMAALIAEAEKHAIPVAFCGRTDVDKIKTTETFAGVLAIVEQPEVELIDLEKEPVIIALDGINDPGNLGTIVRTADWFGVRAILLSENSVDPYNEKSVRSTMGSLFRVNIFKTFDFKKSLEELKQKKWHLNSFTMSGKPLTHLKKQNNSVYIFGSESHGVSDDIRELCECAYAIPGKTQAESLNVAVASGIVLWELSE